MSNKTNLNLGNERLHSKGDCKGRLFYLKDLEVPTVPQERAFTGRGKQD